MYNKILCGCDTDAIYIVLVDLKESASMIQKMEKSELKKVLILDDDPRYQNKASLIISGQYEAICPKCSEVVAGINDNLGEYLMNIIKNENPNVILTDITYGYSPKLMYAGLEISRFIKENYPGIPVIGMTNGFCQQEEIKTSGMFRLIAKTWLKTGLLSAIQECLDSKQQ